MRLQSRPHGKDCRRNRAVGWYHRESCRQIRCGLCLLPQTIYGMIRNSHQIANVIVMGNWGVGKSQFIEELSNMISQERGIRNIFFDSDRYYFEDAVRKDTA